MAAPLVAALAARIRQRTLGVLSAAYSTIAAGRAAAFLGLPEADAVTCEWLACLADWVTPLVVLPDRKC